MPPKRVIDADQICVNQLFLHRLRPLRPNLHCDQCYRVSGLTPNGSAD